MSDPDSPYRMMAIATVMGALVAGLSVVLCGWPWRTPRQARTAAGWVLGLAAAIYAGCYLFEVRLRWPPLEALPRFLILLLPATIVVELGAALPRTPRLLAGGLRLLLAAAAPWIVLWGSRWLLAPSPEDVRRTLGLASGWILGNGDSAPAVDLRMLLDVLLVLSSCALVLVWYLLATLERRTGTRIIPLVMAGTCLGAGATIMYSGDLSDGQLGLPLGAALAGAWTASLLVRTRDGPRGYLGIALISLFCLLMIGHFFGQLAIGHALLLLFAPLLSWVPALLAPRRLPGWARALMQLGLAAVVVTLVLLQAQRQAEQDGQTAPSETSEYENYYH
jgi:hypothetical protein